MFKDIVFPVYRKYKNERHYFKIISQNSFEEIQLVGSKKKITVIQAKQLPEFNHIYDLVFNTDVAISIEEEEYNSVSTTSKKL